MNLVFTIRFVGFIEMQSYLESFNNRPMPCFQGPRGLRGLQGPMGAVGDRVSDFWNAVVSSTLQLLSCKRRKRVVHELPLCLSFSAPRVCRASGGNRASPASSARQ